MKYQSPEIVFGRWYLGIPVSAPTPFYKGRIGEYTVSPLILMLALSMIQI
jgi:hypothetical protein